VTNCGLRVSPKIFRGVYNRLLTSYSGMRNLPMCASQLPSCKSQTAKGMTAGFISSQKTQICFIYLIYDTGALYGLKKALDMKFFKKYYFLIKIENYIISPVRSANIGFAVSLSLRKCLCT